MITATIPNMITASTVAATIKWPPSTAHYPIWTAGTGGNYLNGPGGYGFHAQLNKAPVEETPLRKSFNDFFKEIGELRLRRFSEKAAPDLAGWKVVSLSKANIQINYHKEFRVELNTVGRAYLWAGAELLHDASEAGLNAFKEPDCTIYRVVQQCMEREIGKLRAGLPDEVS